MVIRRDKSTRYKIKHIRKYKGDEAMAAMATMDKTNIFKDEIKEVQESYKHYQENKEEYKVYSSTDEMFKDLGIDL